MSVLKLMGIALVSFMAVSGLTAQAKQTSGAKLPVLALENLFAEAPILLKAKGNNLLFVTFFENKCRWCLRQMNTYQNFQQKLNANFVMVGVGDSKTKLRHWAKRAGTSLPTALASDELLSLVGVPKVTPFTLIFNPKGGFITKVTGYIKPHQLEKLALQYSAQ